MPASEGSRSVSTPVNAAADLDLADFLTLRTIELGVDTPGGLVQDLGLDPAVVSRELTKLTKARLIDRRRPRRLPAVACRSHQKGCPNDCGPLMHHADAAGP
jgi:DNA-binding transcriptional ArsR family regulator